MTHLPALVTLLTVLLLLGTVYAVSNARHRFGIKAPAVSGHPGFERAYRVQMNTIESAVMFLPTLWLAASYGFAGWAGLVGLVWIVGRIWYALAYLKNAEKRGPGFMVAFASLVVLLGMAGFGVVRAMYVG